MLHANHMLRAACRGSAAVNAGLPCNVVTTNPARPPARPPRQAGPRQRGTHRLGLQVVRSVLVVLRMEEAKHMSSGQTADAATCLAADVGGTVVPSPHVGDAATTRERRASPSVVPCHSLRI